MNLCVYICEEEEEELSLLLNKINSFQALKFQCSIYTQK